MVGARGNVVAVGAAAEEEGHVARDHVLARQARHVPLDGHFGSMHRQALDGALQSQVRGHVLEQFVDRAGADHAQHLAAVGVAQWQVTHQFGFLMMKRRRT